MTTATAHHYEVTARDAWNIEVVLHTARTVEQARDYYKGMRLTGTARIVAVQEDGSTSRVA
jgi:hypothetical protein